MILHLLLLASCDGLSAPGAPGHDPARPMDPVGTSRLIPETEVKLPSGAATVRECYAGGSSRPVTRSPSPATTSSTRKEAPARPMAAQSAPEPAPAAAPVESAAAPSVAESAAPGLKALGYGEGGATGGAIANAGAPSGADAAPKTEAAEKKASRAKDDAAPMADKASQPAASRPMDADREEESRMVTRPRENLDWGAKIYLSNDDSMSLASAQRLLWAVQNRGPVKASEIRPHEFLNYFSFDTAPVRDGDLFSVQAAAETTGADTLSMAFAVKGAAGVRQPLDLSLVLDRSGSMSAEGRMAYLKRGLHQMESQLRRGDRVDLVLFDHETCTPLEDYVVGRDDPSLLTDAIDRIQPRGSTDLDSGLREGYRIAAARGADRERNKRMLVITDALLNEGRVDPDLVSEIGKQVETSNIRLSAVGVGREFNDKVLDMLTEKGKGAYVYLGSEAVVDRIFGPMFDSLTHTIAHDVHFSVQLPSSLAMTRFYGEEASTVKEDVKPIHYFANTSQLFLQEVRLRDGAVVPSDPVTLTVEWSDVDTGAARSQSFRSTVGELVAGDPRNLRKGRALMAWTDLLTARALGNEPCGQPFSTWRERVGILGDDAEIGWLDGLTSPLCGATPTPPVASGVDYKVKVDSDQVIAEVQLACSGRKLADSISGSDTVARFSSVTPGACQLTLVGNVPMTAKVNVPATGGEARCTVRGGRVSCG